MVRGCRKVHGRDWWDKKYLVGAIKSVGEMYDNGNQVCRCAAFIKYDPSCGMIRPSIYYVNRHYGREWENSNGDLSDYFIERLLYSWLKIALWSVAEDCPLDSSVDQRNILLFVLFSIGWMVILFACDGARVGPMRMHGLICLIYILVYERFWNETKNLNAYTSNRKVRSIQQQSVIIGNNCVQTCLMPKAIWKGS